MDYINAYLGVKTMPLDTYIVFSVSGQHIDRPLSPAARVTIIYAGIHVGTAAAVAAAYPSDDSFKRHVYIAAVYHGLAGISLRRITDGARWSGEEAANMINDLLWSIGMPPICMTTSSFPCRENQSA